MALIPQDELTTLIAASAAEAVADTAQQTLQEQSVAYTINTAANTGAHTCLYNHPLSEDTITILTSKGYTVEIVEGSARPGSQYVIGGF
jgi:hypothetical protein